MKREQVFKVGQHVRCTYRGVGWRGVIVSYQGDKIYRVIPMTDKHGNPQQNCYVKSYNEYWLEPAELALTDIREDWIKNYEGHSK